MKVPEDQAFLILARHAPTLDAIAERLTDPVRMAMHGALARKMGHYQRAERLARRALVVKPGYLGAIALLSSVLRSTDRVDEALSVTEPYMYCQEPAVLTTRSAALQDVGHSAEAVRLARRAWAISLALPGGPAEELKHLYDRLRSEGAF